MRELTASESYRDLDLVAIFEELPHVICLEVEIMLGNLGLHADFLEFGHLGPLLGILDFLLLLELELSIVEQFAYRGHGLGSNLDKVETKLARNLQSLESGNNPSLLALLVNQAYFAHADLLIDPQVFLCQLASSFACAAS